MVTALGGPIPPKEEGDKGVFIFGEIAVRLLSILLLISLLATLIYSNTFSSSFHFDDFLTIYDNPEIKDLSSLLNLSRSRYVGDLSLALNYHFGKLDVSGYHLVNLLIHIFNGFLVYLLVLLLFQTQAMGWSPSHPSSTFCFGQTPFWIGSATALLFVTHPIQTQAVTYIVQRYASLATFFYLLTVVLYLKWRFVPSHVQYRSFLYAGALIFTVLGMKTKEITFTLPFMLLLIGVVWFGRPTRKQWLLLIPFWLLLPIMPFSLPSLEAGFARLSGEITRLDYLLTQFRVMATYLRLMVLPIHQNLEYDWV